MYLNAKNEKEINARVELFKEIILNKLPTGYLISDEDIIWLKVVGAYWRGSKYGIDLGYSFLEATNRHGISIHIDPFELAIDAGVMTDETLPIALKLEMSEVNA